jgi:hypothetical protein
VNARTESTETVELTRDELQSLVGSNYQGIGPGALDAIADELHLIAHYCDATDEGLDSSEYITVIRNIGDVARRISERARVAAKFSFGREGGTPAERTTFDELVQAQTDKLDDMATHNEKIRKIRRNGRGAR